MIKKYLLNGPVFYGWYIVAVGTLCIFGGLGFGRFALGMLLPAMAPSLKLSYSQMGMISTANFIGYLLAVLGCGVVLKKITSRKIISLALGLVGLSMVLISFAKSFAAVMVLYFLTGIGSAFANVPMMALVAQWFAKSIRGRAAGFVVIGSGFAIILSGRLIPYLNSLSANDGWRLSWVYLGITVLVIAVMAFVILRDSPAELGLLPYRDENAEPELSGEDVKNKPLSRKSIYHLGAIYFCFGSSYVVYATFFVMTMVKERGFSESFAGELWSWVGLLSLMSGPVLGIISDKFGRKIALVIVFVSQSIAYIIVALPLPVYFIYGSIFFYGSVVWSIPTIMTALVGDMAGPAKTASVFGFVTFIFALGQIVGPAVSGHLADISGSFSSSFLLASMLTISGIFLSAKLDK